MSMISTLLTIFTKMAKVNGINALLLFDDDQFPVICSRSIQFDINREMIETSVSGSGYTRTFIPGAIEWSGSCEGFVFIDPTLDAVTQIMYAKILNGEAVFMTWYETDTTGAYYLQKQGMAYISSITEIASFDNMVTFTINFTGSGPISITTGNV